MMNKEDILQIIHSEFGYIEKIVSARKKYIFKKYPDILEFCENFLKEHQQYEKAENVLSAIVEKIDELRKCEICNEELSWSKSLAGHKLCSSKECKRTYKQLHKDKMIAKYKQTCLEKYGVDNASKSEVVKQKILQSNGGINPFAKEDVKEKIRKTNLKRYGVEYANQSELVKDKIRKTNLERYGTNTPLQNKEILAKVRQTNLRKYGTECSLQNKEVREKGRHTCLEKYGVEHTGLCENRLHAIWKNAWNNILSWREYVTPLFSYDEYIKNRENIFKWKCEKCGNIFEQRFYHSAPKDLYHISSFMPRCLKCYPKMSGFSYLEKELVDFCKQYFPKLIENDRELIKPYELDIVISEKKIAIEFNGVYFHSTHNFNRSSNYHLMKTELCEAQGYQLIHIWEHDWINNRKLVERKLKALFNIYDEHIHARKCVVKEISAQEKNAFLNANHIQGEDKSKIKLGLFHDNELVAVMTFGKPRFNKNYEWELIRYATSKHVCGGAGKLLKYFERKYKPFSIISYADRCWSKGNLYRQLGFELVSKSSPNYFYTDNERIIPRYQAQKKNLQKLLGKENFYDQLSEQENMFINRFYQVFDCGNLVFTKYLKIKG